MSTFNPDSFMNTSTSEANDTNRIPVPEGDWTGVIKEVKPRAAKESAILDVIWGIDDEEVARVTGMKSPQIRQSIFLDITEAGGLDCGKGKNVQLGKLREAVGQNQKGRQWSPGMLVGAVAKVKVTHKPYEDSLQANITGVTAA